jgi:PIN domain nuclease of toxin-antitoxin system
MILLLDTHVVLWWLDSPTQLSVEARSAITEPGNDIFVSAVSAWEIAIKRRLGKLDAPSDLEAAILTCGFLPLPISITHAMATEKLPGHHRDPFDRMLIAQAIIESATLITRDLEIRQYDVPIIAA